MLIKKSLQTYCFVSLIVLSVLGLNGQTKINLQYLGKEISEVLYVERLQYTKDHHNTETMFQKGEINEKSFVGNSALKALNLTTNQSRVILESKEGIIRDPEVSFDGKKILFSMRNNKDDYYHIYEIGTDGSNLRQLTFAFNVSDIDPLYLPDGSIVFSSSREPKYCMCNRHIMCNLYRMERDGANITQIGKSTLFEGHSALLNDGRILYDRWEYVDRNFGDAQGLWAVNPDGTKHSIYYGNNMASPGGVIDGRAIPGSSLVVCIFGACHDLPWGALAVIDRRKGVDGAQSVVQIWPSNAMDILDKGDYRTSAFDNIGKIPLRYEDPFPLNTKQILVSRFLNGTDGKYTPKMGLFLVDNTGNETLLLEGEKGIFDAQPLSIRFKPPVIPEMRNYANQTGKFYVQNVYEGTHMNGVEPGSVKYLRVIESPPKLNWTPKAWNGQGVQCPGMNWTNFENKMILGEVPVEEDGSTFFEVPSNKFVYFQLLDKDKKMIQSMRSGSMVQSGEVNGCIGCHENRINPPPPTGKMAIALRRSPTPMNGWMGKAPEPFSFTKTVQPIFNKYCVSCHDFDEKDRTKLVLAPDNNPFFNASYIDLNVKKKILVIGAGPAEIQQPYTWGAHASILTKVIDNHHKDIKLSEQEKQVLYTWMDLNAVYYPTYDSAYPDNIAGRCPLDDQEMKRLKELTGIDFDKINGFNRTVGPQIAFERPELSPCLDKIRNEKPKYDEAVALISKGKERLKIKPNGAVLEGFVPCQTDQDRLKRYADKLNEENEFMKARADGRKRYDKN
ncbi:MAG: hypothetical protein WCP85_15580 [Mariniphaga sp.]